MRDILVFLSDQHAAGCAGYAGDPVVRTPNLDRIARTGVVMKNAYTAYPLCVPVRMSLLSGQLPSKERRLLSHRLRRGWNPETLREHFKTRMEHLSLQQEWIKNQNLEETDRWKTSVSAVQIPQEYLSFKTGGCYG
jgi:hypothetical protein